MAPESAKYSVLYFSQRGNDKGKSTDGDFEAIIPKSAKIFISGGKKWSILQTTCIGLEAGKEGISASKSSQSYLDIRRLIFP